MEAYSRSYSRSAFDHYEFDNRGLAQIEGYRLLAENIRKRGIDMFVNFLADRQICGTPQQVFEKVHGLPVNGQQRRADRDL